MPLPSKSDVDSKKECIEKTIQIEVNAGKPRDQAVAIAHSHCDKIFEFDYGKSILRKLHTLSKLSDPEFSYIMDKAESARAKKIAHKVKVGKRLSKQESQIVRSLL